MFYRRAYFVLALLLVVSLACSVGGAAPTEAPTPDASATAQVMTDVAHGVETAQAAAQTAEAATQAVHATAEAATASAATATSVAILAETATRARFTEVAAEKKATKVAATEQAIVGATAQAEPLAQVVRQLVADGYLTHSEGAYSALPDFLESWAQINYYQWRPTGFEPADFVVRADTSWTSASDTANWFASGCGFVFREMSRDNHYLIFLSLDGYVRLSDVRNGVFHILGDEYYGKVGAATGSAQVMLVVEGSVFNYFVNGERVLTRESASFPEGRLGLTLVSGTNKSFGTRCSMKNIELWELK
jgi:hypothetical protein